jgi:HD-GYP domain-containing protein (c-di-GMP phosphodiesterase class II)
VTTRHRIRLDQLRIGAPLPVDVYDSNNRLLLRRGHIITTDHQLDRLVEEGLFADQPLPTLRHPKGDDAERGSHPGDEDDPLIDGSIPRATAKATHRVSIYAEVAAAAKTLEALLCAPEANPDFSIDVAHVAGVLSKACRLEPDAALGYTMFAREVRYPVRQSVNVAILTALLLERMNTDAVRLRAAVCAALTMNLSIQALQDVLYRQQTMTDAQRKDIHVHPAQSAAQLLSLRVQDPLWRAIVEQHHEFIDGTGYPGKLAGDAVLPEARVIGLADRFFATVSERAYRAAIAPDTAINHIRTRSGTAIDPKLVDELVHWIGMYPPGTVVELVNRDVAIVTRRLRDPRHPVVMAVAGQNLRPFEWPRKRLTASQPQFHIEHFFPRETITFPVDPESLWPRTVTDHDPPPA